MVHHLPKSSSAVLFAIVSPLIAGHSQPSGNKPLTCWRREQGAPRSCKSSISTRRHIRCSRLPLDSMCLFNIRQPNSGPHQESSWKSGQTEINSSRPKLAVSSVGTEGSSDDASRSCLLSAAQQFPHRCHLQLSSSSSPIIPLNLPSSQSRNKNVRPTRFDRDATASRRTVTEGEWTR